MRPPCKRRPWGAVRCQVFSAGAGKSGGKGTSRCTGRDDWAACAATSAAGNADCSDLGPECPDVPADQGPPSYDVLAALVMMSLRQELAEARAQLEKARERIAELEARLKRNPRNSSKPSERLARPAPRSRRSKSGCKPGGQAWLAIRWPRLPARTCESGSCSVVTSAVGAVSPCGFTRRVRPVVHPGRPGGRERLPAGTRSIRGWWGAVRRRGVLGWPIVPAWPR